MNIMNRIAKFLRAQCAASAEVAADIIEDIAANKDPAARDYYNGDNPSWEIRALETGGGYKAYPVSYSAYCQVKKNAATGSVEVEFSTVSAHGFRMFVTSDGRADFHADQFASEQFWADGLQGWVATQYRGNKLAAEWQGRKYRLPSRWEREEAAKCAAEAAAEARKADDAARKAAKEAFDEARRSTPGTRAWRRHHRCA